MDVTADLFESLSAVLKRLHLFVEVAEVISKPLQIGPCADCKVSGNCAFHGQLEHLIEGLYPVPHTAVIHGGARFVEKKISHGNRSLHREVNKDVAGSVRFSREINFDSLIIHMYGDLFLQREIGGPKVKSFHAGCLHESQGSSAGEEIGRAHV